MSTDGKRTVILKELTDLISKGNAHATFDDAVADLALDQLTITPKLLPYNIWQLAEHIRIAQWDIVEFCINPNHKSPKWPDEYWVKGDEKVTAAQWQDTLAQVKADRARFIDLIKDPSNDLYEPFSHGSGQNLFREALLIADHTSYHTGEIIIIRRLLQNWH